MMEYIGYTSNLDRLTHVIVELRSVLIEFRDKIPRVFTKLGYTCRVIKTHTIRIHLKKSLCVGLMSEIELKTVMSLLLNHNHTCYANVQVVNTFVYA